MVVSVQTDDLVWNTRTTIQTLPPELLLLIFEFCYEDFKLGEEGLPQLENPPWHYVSGGLDPSSMRPSSPSSLFERFRSPTRFPFALAAVSPFWEQLLTSQPEWWTEIILPIGPTHPSSTGHISEILTKVRPVSECIPLDFMVFCDRDSQEPNRVPEEDYSAETERRLLNRITDLLFAYYDQCRSISIEAVYGRSFPDIGCWYQLDTFFYDPSPSSILLTWQIDEGYVRDADIGYENGDKVYHLYENCFKSLVMNGRNLDFIYPIFLAYQRTNLVQLIILDYTSTTNGIGILEFLRILNQAPNLTSVKLQNVEFGHDPERQPASFTCNIFRLHLETISLSMTRELFRLCTFTQLESLHITDCVYSPLHLLSTNILILERLDIDHHVSLRAVLGDWQGSCLWMGRSRANHDNIFDMLRKFDQPTDEFLCPWMDISDLSPLSQEI